MRERISQFALFIGFEGDLDDANTNEIIYRIINDGRSSVSMEFVEKEYKGKNIPVLEVTRTFVENFYAKKYSFKLKFVVYAEINFVLQRFRLLEPGMKKRAKQVQTTFKFFKKIKNEL
jgi:hypothetical protein